MTVEKEIKEAMKEEKLIIGSKSVIKNIKLNAVEYVICSANCTEDVINDLSHYSKNFAVEIKKFKGNSRQLGEICGKPFNVMLLGVKK